MRKRLALLAAAALVTSGCAVQTGEPAPVPTPTSTPSPTVDPLALDPLTLGPVEAVGEPTVIATGFTVPWSMVRLESGSTLVSERDTALVKEVLADGSVREVGAVAGVVPEGEGGLLGLEFWDGTLFAYVTAVSDNRIVAIELLGGPGSYALGEMTEVLTGIPKWSTHNGGRIKVGPDEKLYATVGDAQNRPASQDLASLSGKILRMNLDGSVPADNPFEGSLVYSLGHRNPQGIAWDRDGQLWAAEFGQDTWDEFNIITAGSNYGWPVVEGIGSDPAFVNPVYQWSTDAASPSGLVFTRDTFFLAALRGQRVWGIYPSAEGTTATEFYTGQFGRIRDVVAGPDGTLWLLTNNTGGRGELREGDDRILQVELVPRSAG